MVLVFLFFFFKKYFLIAIFILALSLGVWRYDLKESKSKIGDDKLSSLVGEKTTLVGIIDDEPKVTEKSTKLTVKIDDQKVEINAGLFPRFKYGDKIKAYGKLEKPEGYYKDYLAKDDIFYELSFANASLISSGHGSFIKSKLFDFKNTFTNKINLLIKEPESSLLAGLLLGAKNSLGKVWQEDFRKAGVSHIVALSGYNITIVAEGIIASLSFLPRVLSLSAGAFGIFLFAIMTGGSATVLRASVMALLVLLAKATNRTYDVVRALCVAGLFMVIQNPKILVFDVSFQLSFLSTLALIFVSPILERRFLFITEKYRLRELILSTISTQIFVLPFIFYKMGMISLVSLPANILILPIIPTIMLLGFITGILSFLSTLLALPFAFISSLLLSYILKVIKLFADLSFSSLTIENFPLVLVVLIYLVFTIIIVRSKIVVPPRTNSD